MSGIQAVLLFIIPLFFNLYLFALWLRIALRFCRISSLNPFSQMIHRFTNPLVNPVARLFYLGYKPGQVYDWAALLWIIVLTSIKILLIGLIVFGQLLAWILSLLYVGADLIMQPSSLLLYLIVVRVIMDLVQPHWPMPLREIIYRFTEPSYRLGRKIIPNISGFDFSPYVIILILIVIRLFIRYSLPWQLI